MRITSRAVLVLLWLLTSCQDDQEHPEPTDAGLDAESSDSDGGLEASSFDAALTDVRVVPMPPACVHACPALAEVRCEAGKVSVCSADERGCRGWAERATCAIGCDASGAHCAGCSNNCTSSTCTEGQAARCTVDNNGCSTLATAACASNSCYDETRCAVITSVGGAEAHEAITIGSNGDVWRAGTTYRNGPPSIDFHAELETATRAGSWTEHVSIRLGSARRAHSVTTTLADEAVLVGDTGGPGSSWQGIVQLFPAQAGPTTPPVWSQELTARYQLELVSSATRGDGVLLVGGSAIGPIEDRDRQGEDRQALVVAYEPAGGARLWLRAWKAGYAIVDLAADRDAVYALGLGTELTSTLFDDPLVYAERRQLARLAADGSLLWDMPLTLAGDPEPNIVGIAAHDGVAMVVYGDSAGRAWLAAYDAGQRLLYDRPLEGLQTPSDLDVMADGSLLLLNASPDKLVRVDTTGKVITSFPTPDSWLVAASRAPLEQIVAGGTQTWVIRPESP